MKVDKLLALRFLAPTTHIIKMEKKATIIYYFNIYLPKTCGIGVITFYVPFFLHFLSTFDSFLFKFCEFTHLHCC